MTAPATPAPANPAPAAPATPAATPPASPSSGAQPSTPATPTTPASPSPLEAEVARLRKLTETQDAVIREQASANSRTAAEIQRLRTDLTPAPAPKDPKDFFASPHAEVKKVVQEELAATIAPIEQLLKELVGGSKSSAVIAQAKAKHPQFNWAVLEPVVNGLARDAAQRGLTVDDGVMGVFVRTAMGMAATGEIEGAFGMPPAAPAPSPSPLPPTVPPVLPPHMPPSPAPVPVATPAAPAVRALTEAEARLAREKNQTPEQFLAWMNVAPEDIINFKAPGEK